MTEADYGYLFCWAENIARRQREPCSQPNKRDNHYQALLWIQSILRDYVFNFNLFSGTAL